MEKREKQEIQKQYHPVVHYIRLAAGWMCLLAGSLLAIYVGIWLMIIKPLMQLYLSYRAGKLYTMMVVVALVKCGLSLTVGGTIWLIGYIVKYKLEDTVLP